MAAEHPVSDNASANGPPRRTDSDSPPRRVLVWMEASRAYGRGCLIGVAGFARSHGNWRVFHFDHQLGQDVPPYFADLEIDGILSRVERQFVADQLASLGKPVVDLRGVVRLRNGVTFDSDHVACAELAIEHFWNRGFRRMAVCGYERVGWSERRRESFEAMAAERGVSCSAFMLEASLALETTALREARGEHEDPRLDQWLLDLPKPVAIFATNDVRGRQVVASCRALGLAVPEQVAVLGVDNDDVVCELSDPPLSSIEPDTYRLGYEGAAMLESLMRSGGPAPELPVQIIRPKRVIARQSTDVAAIEDELVATALRQIRERGGSGVTVASLSRDFGVSRTTLERRFRDAIGRSPRQEIDRVRLDRARSLVHDTGYPLHQIADMTGYSNASRLLGAYRRRFGITPGADRERMALRGPAADAGEPDGEAPAAAESTSARAAGA